MQELQARIAAICSPCLREWALCDRIVDAQHRRHYRRTWQLALAHPERARELLCVPTGLEPVPPHMAAAPAAMPPALSAVTRSNESPRNEHRILRAAYRHSRERLVDLVNETCQPKPAEMTHAEWAAYLNGPVLDRICDIQKNNIDVADWPHLEGDFKL